MKGSSFFLPWNEELTNKQVQVVRTERALLGLIKATESSDNNVG